MPKDIKSQYQCDIIIYMELYTSTVWYCNPNKYCTKTKAERNPGKNRTSLPTKKKASKILRLKYHIIYVFCLVKEKNRVANNFDKTQDITSLKSGFFFFNRKINPKTFFKKLG